MDLHTRSWIPDEPRRDDAASADFTAHFTPGRVPPHVLKTGDIRKRGQSHRSPHFRAFSTWTTPAGSQPRWRAEPRRRQRELRPEVQRTATLVGVPSSPEGQGLPSNSRHTPANACSRRPRAGFLRPPRPARLTPQPSSHRFPRFVIWHTAPTHGAPLLTIGGILAADPLRFDLWD